MVGSARRELLDHVIILNEKHLQRLIRSYVDYYNADRVHTTLQDSRWADPPSADPHRWPESLDYPESVDSIIATSGGKQLDGSQ